MEIFKVDSILVLPFDVDNSAGWAFQVLVKGSGFMDIATPIAARLGPQTLEATCVHPGGAGFSGYIKKEPRDGDKLLVNYSGLPLLDTGVVYQKRPPIG